MDYPECERNLLSVILDLFIGKLPPPIVKISDLSHRNWSNISHADHAVRTQGMLKWARACSTLSARLGRLGAAGR